MKRFQNITEKEIKTTGVQSLPTRPNRVSRFGEPPMSAQSLKLAFDALAVLVAGRVNEIQDELNGVGAERMGDAIAIPTLTMPGGGGEVHTLYELVGVLPRLAEYMYVINPVSPGMSCTLSGYISQFFDYVNSKLASEISFEKYGEEWRVCLYSKTGAVVSRTVFDEQIIVDTLLKNGFTGEMLADCSVEGDKLCDGAVSTQKLSDGAVSTQKLSDGAVSEEKLSSSLKSNIFEGMLQEVEFDAAVGMLSFIFADGTSKSIDLPTELIVSSGYYSEKAGGTIVLVLANGDEISIPIKAFANKILAMPSASASDAGKIPIVTQANKYELKKPYAEYESEGLEFTLSEDGTFYTWSGIGTCTDKKIIVPRLVNGILVKKVGAISGLMNLSGKTEIVLQSGIEEIAQSGLAFGMKVERITLPDTLKIIGNYAFQMCGFKQITLPEGLERIGSYAFVWGQLTEITIPSTVKALGAGALSGTSSSRKITVLCSEVPTLEGHLDADGNVYLHDCNIYVPANLVASYKEATNWSQHADRIRSQGNRISDVSCIGEAGYEEIELVTESGSRVSAPQSKFSERIYLITSLLTSEDTKKYVEVQNIPLDSIVRIEVIVRNDESARLEADAIFVPWREDMGNQYIASGLCGYVTELLIAKVKSKRYFYFNTEQLKLAEGYSFVSARIRVAPAGAVQLL